MIRSLITASAVAASLVVVGASPAEAAYNLGVSYVRLDSDPHICLPQGALPQGFGGAEDCAGSLPSNTIYVQQTENGDSYEYTDIVGTGSTADDVWVKTIFEAKCRSDYRLFHAFTREGYSDYSGGLKINEVSQDAIPPWAQQMDVNSSNRTIPPREIDINMPIDRAEYLHFNTGAWGGAGYGTSFLERAEILVADAIADGDSVHDARHTTRSEVIDFDIHGGVICRGVAWPHYKKEKHNSATVPVEVVYLGIGQEPGHDWRTAEIPPEHGPGVQDQAVGDLAGHTQVTDVSFSTSLDEADPCRLNLRAVFHTNAPTTIEYRVVDELGVGSVQDWSIDIDDTMLGVADHYVMLPVVESSGGDGPGGWLVNPEDQDGELGLAHEGSNNEQGYYQVEFSTPHHGWSEVASYNVAPCITPRPGGLTATRGPQPVQTWVVDLG
jgi:hypothetical protein